MRPPFNSFPHRPNQGQGDSIHNASSRQVLSQMNMMPLPFNGSMAHMNMAPGFMNAPNGLLPMPNNQLAMQQMGLLGNMPGLNGQFPNHMAQNANQMNMFQVPGQLPLNGNMAFPNMQLNLPNAIQALNQLLAMQMSNSSQIPQYNGFPGSNQVMGPQNPQFGLLQQMNQIQQPHMAPANSHSSQADRSQISQNLVGNNTQESNTDNGATSTPNKFQKNFPRRDFARNQNGEASRTGFQKSNFHHMKNGKGKFGNRDRNRSKGISDGQVGNGGMPNSVNQAKEPKGCYWMTYTDKDVQEWREERRKNHPSNTDLKKKVMDSNTKETITMARREQLKGILAKQAELGVEVAEIPKHYLVDSATNVQGTDQGNKRPPFTKERFQNKFDKRRRRGDNRKDRFNNKKLRLEEATSNRAPPTMEKSQPSLLKKLLGKDIQRDKVRLLQVFRFMVSNSFFKDWPQQTLKFPVVTVNNEEVHVGDASMQTPAGNIDGNGDDNDNDSLGDNGLPVEEEKEDEEEEEEEEGEITD